jgi:hypothetical protein
MRTPFGSSIGAGTGKERGSFRPLLAHDNERPRAFKSPGARGEDTGSRRRLKGPGAGEVDEPAICGQEPLRHLPRPIGRRERPGRADVCRARLELLRTPGENGRVGQLQPLHGEFEEGHLAALRLHQTDLELGSRDRENDPREAGSGSQIERRAVFRSDLGYGAEGVKDVPFPQSVLVGTRHEAQWDGPLAEERLIGEEPFESRVRERDSEPFCRGADVLAATDLFHVKRYRARRITTCRSGSSPELSVATPETVPAASWTIFRS